MTMCTYMYVCKQCLTKRDVTGAMRWRELFQFRPFSPKVSRVPEIQSSLNCGSTFLTGSRRWFTTEVFSRSIAHCRIFIGLCMHMCVRAFTQACAQIRVFMCV
jgi:predicted nucleic acid-binding Zn ribbon protein